jgi:cleavage and polyadenylation specificity factor subunit 5
VKECIKLFLIRLPMSRQFVVPKNMKLLAVPLSQIHSNTQVCLVSEILEFKTKEVSFDIRLSITHLQVYGPVISGIPNLLSKFSLNVISD